MNNFSSSAGVDSSWLQGKLIKEGDNQSNERRDTCRQTISQGSVWEPWRSSERQSSCEGVIEGTFG